MKWPGNHFNMTLLFCAVTRDVPVGVRYTRFIDRVSDRGVSSFCCHLVPLILQNSSCKLLHVKPCLWHMWLWNCHVLLYIEAAFVSHTYKYISVL